MASIKNLTPRVLLCIMDGYGVSANERMNAIKSARRPNLDRLFANYPFTTIQPGGEAVGLPKGVAGNSEVGHINLGAGRPVRQDLVRINEAVALGTFKDMPRWQDLLEQARRTGRLHLLGLLSDGGVHSHINHLKHILSLLKSESFDVFLHAFTDGRDTAKDTGVKHVRDIMVHGGFRFASLQGRSIGMDRDRRWEKIRVATETLTGKSGVVARDPAAYLESEYAQGRFDEFATPALFIAEGAIRDGDPVFFINFRPDRARQITLAFNDPSFSEYAVGARPGYWLCMSPYVPDELPQLPVLFDKEKVRGTIGEYLAKLGLRQFKIAETEKYAHVTYFFNGGEEQPFLGEERLLVPSPKEVATYDLKPAMSANAVCDALVEKLADHGINFYVVNFANCDMVGHTGNFAATVAAVETVDACVGRLAEACAKNNVALIITADHGNADQMTYEDGSVQTSHSDSEVPFCVVHPSLAGVTLPRSPALKTPALKDVAPTVLALMGLPQPPEFTGEAVFP